MRTFFPSLVATLLLVGCSDPPCRPNELKVGNKCYRRSSDAGKAENADDESDRGAERADASARRGADASAKQDASGSDDEHDSLPASSENPPDVTSSSPMTRDAAVEDAGPLCAPAPETCNGKDDDCDGLVDEKDDLKERPIGQSCTSGGQGACSQGTQVCFQGAIKCSAATEPSAEVCDGLDNDCNGKVDDAPGSGEPCTAGESECKTSGVRECDSSGKMACNAKPKPAQIEVCDNKDNDCNGTVDDVSGKGEPCTAGTGGCEASGTKVCGSSGLICNAMPKAAQPESCDGVDNDCNGKVDDAPSLCTTKTLYRACAQHEDCDSANGEFCDITAKVCTRYCPAHMDVAVYNAASGCPEPISAGGFDLWPACVRLGTAFQCFALGCASGADCGIGSACIDASNLGSTKMCTGCNMDSQCPSGQRCVKSSQFYGKCQ